ncbi:MAG: hypothetical protein MJ142_07355 [Clostridia bacterium]|nr:hypothetical protein [Clostridia bacterium]
MAYYCGECAVWVGSSDVDRYGRRWCSYSRKYEESNQNIYGCRGFVYNGRTVLTKVCEILAIPTGKWFEAFDAVKDAYVAPKKTEWLANYCKIGPQIAAKLDADNDRHAVAESLMDQYIKPAYQLWKEGNSEQSAMKYREMVLTLAKQYCLA